MKPKYFVGKLVIFGCDFRQILLVTNESSNKKHVLHNMTKNIVYREIFSDNPDAWLVYFQ